MLEVTNLMIFSFLCLVWQAFWKIIYISALKRESSMIEKMVDFVVLKNNHRIIYPLLYIWKLACLVEAHIVLYSYHNIRQIPRLVASKLLTMSKMFTFSDHEMVLIFGLLGIKLKIYYHSYSNLFNTPFSTFKLWQCIDDLINHYIFLKFKW
jgi:hypothetical protein